MIRNSTAKIKDLIVHYYDKNHIFKKRIQRLNNCLYSKFTTQNIANSPKRIGILILQIENQQTKF